MKDIDDTVANVLNRLGDIAVESEDDQLKGMVMRIAKVMRIEHLPATAKVRILSIPKDHNTLKTLAKLVGITHIYCNNVLRLKHRNGTYWLGDLVGRRRNRTKEKHSK